MKFGYTKSLIPFLRQKTHVTVTSKLTQLWQLPVIWKIRIKTRARELKGEETGKRYEKDG